jgi:hypothetical protein
LAKAFVPDLQPTRSGDAKYRRAHLDKSRIHHSKWQIQRTVIRPSASSINRVPSQPVTLREAQNLAEKAMEK